MTVQHIVMLEFNDGVDEETRMNSLKAVEGLKTRPTDREDQSVRISPAVQANSRMQLLSPCVMGSAIGLRPAPGTRRCRGFSARWSKPCG